ncbi:hypothetical protein HOY82DRAFT_85812 [Tuber indicum]|nr:hypothetical protein HOY82DRAFT_85812 [Tuber indicum]
MILWHGIFFCWPMGFDISSASDAWGTVPGLASCEINTFYENQAMVCGSVGLCEFGLVLSQTSSHRCHPAQWEGLTIVAMEMVFLATFIENTSIIVGIPSVIEC